jgi:hypothetical protein
MSSTSSSIFYPAEHKRELGRYSGWKRHAAWAVLGMAFLLGSGAVGSVAARSSRGEPVFTPHITAPAIGRSAVGTSGSLALVTETGWTRWGTIDDGFGGGPPIP